MVLTTKEPSYIIVLGIVISVLTISSTLTQDSIHVHFKQTRNQRGTGAIQTALNSSKQLCLIISLSDSIPNDICISTSDTVPATVTETFSVHIEAVSESNSDHSQCSTLLFERGIRQWHWEAVGEHLRSWYVALVDFSVCSHICSKIGLGRNVRN
jgi:hypothetical protein